MAKNKGCGCFPLLILLGAAGYGGYYWYDKSQQEDETAALTAENERIQADKAAEAKQHELNAAKSAMDAATEQQQAAEERAKQAEERAKAAEEAARQAEEKMKQLQEETRAKIEAAKREAEEAAQKATESLTEDDDDEEEEDADDEDIDIDLDLDSLTETGAPTPVTGTTELNSLIQTLQNKHFEGEYNQLLQKRLVTLLQRIAEGADVNTVAEDANGTTALHNACGLGEVDIVIWLLRKGADVRIKTAKGASVTDCIGNDADGRVRLIIQSVLNDVQEDAGLAREELGPIIARIQAMKATSSNKLYRTRLLTLLPMIMNGEDVNLTLTETKGNTALHYACGLGDVELVTWLLENGADPNKLTDKGMSPYKCAGGKQVKTIQNLLKEYGANP